MIRNFYNSKFLYLKNFIIQTCRGSIASSDENMLFSVNEFLNKIESLSDRCGQVTSYVLMLNFGITGMKTVIML